MPAGIAGLVPVVGVDVFPVAVLFAVVRFRAVRVGALVPVVGGVGFDPGRRPCVGMGGAGIGGQVVGADGEQGPVARDGEVLFIGVELQLTARGQIAAGEDDDIRLLKPFKGFAGAGGHRDDRRVAVSLKAPAGLDGKRPGIDSFTVGGEHTADMYARIPGDLQRAGGAYLHLSGIDGVSVAPFGRQGPVYRDGPVHSAAGVDRNAAVCLYFCAFSHGDRVFVCPAEVDMFVNRQFAARWLAALKGQMDRR